MLSKSQFIILTEIEKNKYKMTQRELSEKTGMSLGNINKIINYLIENGLIHDMLITENGNYALAPYRVKRAVFIAAGFGSRLVPITLNTPKPLVKVNGKRMIDTLLDAVVSIGITDITIVRGYLGEQFDILLKKYPYIRFVDNTMYNEANNISSAYLVRDLYENAYVMDADLVLYNNDIITKYQYNSNYLGVPVDRTDDWCLLFNGKRITKMQLGGENCYHMLGISYWTNIDGKNLYSDIEKTFKMPGGKERYWDQVPLEYFASNYNVDIRPCKFTDIVEIDSFSELKKIDKIYDC